jgi:hypothetical protein
MEFKAFGQLHLNRTNDLLGVGREEYVLHRDWHEDLHVATAINVHGVVTVNSVEPDRQED